jgi:CRISPR-associated endonuclease Cas1
MHACIVLRKYGLRAHDLLGVKGRIDKAEAENLEALRRKLTGIEGKATEHYFKHIFQLIQPNLRPDKRRIFKAYDGVNNIFNLAYEMLSWKVHRAIVKAKLEPYLGFLHSLQHGKPSARHAHIRRSLTCGLSHNK